MLGLGVLAVVPGVPSIALAVTYVLSPFAYLAAAVAIPFGVMARGDKRGRLFGTAAVVLALVVIILATLVLAPYG